MNARLVAINLKIFRLILFVPGCFHPRDLFEQFNINHMAMDPYEETPSIIKVLEVLERTKIMRVRD